ncbi:MAG: phosphate ABC transporter substrate-binding protein [Chloroflexi bacterium]|nr:MAG: phosphate ABC transporter substrate-binding protein [Chloroflexota bacterium]
MRSPPLNGVVRTYSSLPIVPSTASSHPAELELGVLIEGAHRRSTATSVLGALVAACLVAACGVAAPPSPTPDPISGQYTASGGGGALPAVQALTARFKELHPAIDWVVTETGSNSAIKLVLSNTIDLGFVSRSLTESESRQVTPVPIGFSGTALVAHAGNPATNVTKDDLRRIYSGEVMNWSELGGIDQAVRPYIREPNAATRQTFETFLFGATPPSYGKNVTQMVEVDALLTAVGSFRGAIGIASTGSRTASDKRVKILSVDGVPPTLESIANGSYKIVRPLFLIYGGDLAALKPALRAFLEFVKGPEGQRIAAAAF